MNKVSLSNPFFSIIMPCYNSEEYLDYAVESVKSQSYHDWELIAINDGSTDSTLSMLEQYSANDKRIKVFSKQNGGYCSAVNVGLDNVRGSYFLFMGSDDALAEDVLLKIFNEVNDSFPDFVGFRTLCRRDGGGTVFG